jgi:hypothetical protein
MIAIILLYNRKSILHKQNAYNDAKAENAMFSIGRYLLQVTVEVIHHIVLRTNIPAITLIRRVSVTFVAGWSGYDILIVKRLNLSDKGSDFEAGGLQKLKFDFTVESLADLSSALR